MVHLCRGTFRAIMQFCSIWALSLSCLRHLLSLVCGAKHILNLALNLLSPPLVLFSSPVFSLTEMLVWIPGLCICHKYLLPCSHQFSLPGYKNKHLQTTASSTSATSGWCTFNSDWSFRECRSGVMFLQIGLCPDLTILELVFTGTTRNTLTTFIWIVQSITRNKLTIDTEP